MLIIVIIIYSFNILVIKHTSELVQRLGVLNYSLKTHSVKQDSLKFHCSIFIPILVVFFENRQYRVTSSYFVKREGPKSMKVIAFRATDRIRGKRKYRKSNSFSGSFSLCSKTTGNWPNYYTLYICYRQWCKQCRR